MAFHSGLAPFGSQTLIELHVGKESRKNQNNNKATTSNTTVEVMIRLAREDISWWNKDVDGHWKQLCKIIGRRILPVEFPSLLSSSSSTKYRSDTAAAAAAAVSKANHKQKTNAPIKKGKSNKTSLAKLPLPPSALNYSAGFSSNSTKKRDTGNVTNLFGDTIQITYQVEELRPSERATLLYQSDNEEDEETGRNETKSFKGSYSGENKTDQVKRIPKAATSFRRCTKLPKRISIWCHPFDPENPTQPTTSNAGGFPRPELIPMASLFREFEPST